MTGCGRWLGITRGVILGIVTLSMALAPNRAAAAENPAPIASPLAQGCRPQASVQAELRAAGQFPLLSATGGATRVVLSSDQALQVGYILETQQDQVCVVQRYRSIRLNAQPAVAIPSWAPLDGKGQQYNGLLVEEMLRNGGRVVFGAVAITPEEQLLYRVAAIRNQTGELVLVAGRPDGSFNLLATRSTIAFDSNFTALSQTQPQPGTSPLQQLTGASRAAKRGTAAAERACQLGEVALCGVLAQLYDGRAPTSDNPGFPRDVTRGFELATIGCQGNDAASCLQVALAYDTGQGTARSPALAIQHYRKAIALDPDRDKPLSIISSPARGGLAKLGVKP